MKKLHLILALSLFGFAFLNVYPASFKARAKADDPVLATVNGSEITLSQLTPLIEEYRQRANKPEVKPEEKAQILRGLIRRQLILQQKEAQALRADQRIVSQVKDLENKLVVAAFLENHVGKYLTVSDEEIKTFYQENIQKFSSPPKVKARHILLRNREDAEMVLAKLRNGSDFGQTAKEHSIDLPMALEGGPMGTIEKGRSLPELEKALFILKVGEISDVVETRYGYHVLTVDEIITTQFRSLEEVRELIRKGILQQKEAKAFDEMTAELEQNAKIQIFEANLLHPAQ